jgi:hypothetical protein
LLVPVPNANPEWQPWRPVHPVRIDETDGLREQFGMRPATNHGEGSRGNIFSGNVVRAAGQAKSVSLTNGKEVGARVTAEYLPR